MKTFIRKTDEKDHNIAEILEEFILFHQGMYIRLDNDETRYEVKQVVYKIARPSLEAKIANLEQYVFIGEYDKEK